MPGPFEDMDPLKRHLAGEAERKASRGGGGTSEGIVDGGEIVGDLVAAAVSSDAAGTVVETVASAAEVSGHVLSGALDVLGSAGDLAGCLDGCSGCSAVIAFVSVMGTAGAVLARSLY